MGNAENHTMLMAAEYWAGKGFPVLPCCQHLKKPAIEGGLKSATTDPDKLKELFGSDPRNIGLRCGNGLVVIDIDVKNGIDGKLTLQALESQHGKLPPTLTVSTPSGGFHLYYQYPDNMTIRTTVGKMGDTKTPNIDVRADGGYVVAPPSKLDASADPSGKIVSGEYAIQQKRPIADLPSAWLALLAGRDTHQPKPSHPPKSRGQQLTEIQSALQHIDAKPHDDWIRVGMALYGLGDAGRALWDTWSMTADNYDPAEIHKRWGSFSGTSVSVETIYYMAQQNGWANPAKGKRPQQDARVVPFPQHQHRAGEHESAPQHSRKPEPLPSELPPVMKLNPAWLPQVVGEYIADAAEQMNAPPDYLAVTLLSAMATVIGRKIGVRPQENTDWTEIVNMWALLVGRPGMLKSPTMGVGLRPLYRLIKQANERNADAKADWDARQEVERIRVGAAKDAYKKALTKDKSAAIDPAEFRQNEEDPPPEKRYMTSDATVEALLEVLRTNENGIMVFRDELIGLLKGMEREDRAEQRAMFLTGWNGNSPFTSDRIGRGLNLTVEAVCLSVLGATQPGKVAAYVRQAVNGGDGDDGLLQRFGLTVWPDVGGYVEIDRPPDKARLMAVNALFDYLDQLKPQDVEAQQDKDAEGKADGIPYLRFDSEALAIFRDWRTDLENELRSDELHQALESHLAKYRKMVPGLALILHLADRQTGSIGIIPLLQAINLAAYFRSHAERLYASVAMPEVQAAKVILRKLKAGDIPHTFKARDIYRKGWAGLDRATVEDSLSLLVDHDWLDEFSEDTAGRPTVMYAMTEGVLNHA